MNKQNKTPRTYKRITPESVAEFKAQAILAGNNTAAIRKLEPTRISPKDRAFRIAKKSEEESTLQFIDKQLEQIGIDAVNRIGKMVNSSNEGIATKNSHFVVEQLKGKAVQKSESKNINVNIETVLQ